MRLLKSSVLVAATIAVGCVAKDDIKEVSNPASALSKVELQSILVGHTFPFSKGGMYFISDTEATVHWDGKSEDTNWYATDDSKFCYTVKLFGGEEECLGLKRTPTGDYLREFEGKNIPVKAENIKEGKAF